MLPLPYITEITIDLTSVDFNPDPKNHARCHPPQAAGVTQGFTTALVKTSSLTGGNEADTEPRRPTGMIECTTFGGGPWIFATVASATDLGMNFGTARYTASVTAAVNAFDFSPDIGPN